VTGVEKPGNVEDSHLAEVLRERGSERARAFSWESAAGKTLEVFAQAVQS
jgi:hypothetical protein